MVAGNGVADARGPASPPARKIPGYRRDKRIAPSSLVDVGQLAAALERFAAERNWAQFHSPKNLVMALTGEVGELSEIFQWMDEEQSKDAARHPDTAQAVQDELADVLMYLVRLASVLGVDLDAAARQKLEQNNRKYPVEKARNSSKKYDQF